MLVRSCAKQIEKLKDIPQALNRDKYIGINNS